MIPQPDPRDLARHVWELDGMLTETAAIRCTLPDGEPLVVRFLDKGRFVISVDPGRYDEARAWVHAACRLDDVTLTAMFQDAAAEARQASRRFLAHLPEYELPENQPRTRRGMPE
jgi:hypothetical protein